MRAALIDPPYEAIWDLMRKGQVVPFLGAGASLTGRPPKTSWSTNRDFLPSGRELSRYLADAARFPERKQRDREELARVASYYLDSVDRPSLQGLLRDIFWKESLQPGAVHRFLREVADRGIALLIVTTNYDTLIERAFQGKPYHLVVPSGDSGQAGSVLWWEPGSANPQVCAPNGLNLYLTDTTIIYKMHGSLDQQRKDWDSFVISEEDYVEFLTRMTKDSAIPASFHLHFCASPVPVPRLRSGRLEFPRDVEQLAKHHCRPAKTALLGDAIQSKRDRKNPLAKAEREHLWR